MKTQYIDYSHNSDLPESVRQAIPDDALQSVFRAALNSHLRDGRSEMHAYIKAYRALEDLGYVKGEDGKWSVAKDAPGVGDVHVPRPLGSGKKPKRKDDPGTDPADIPEFEDLAEQLGKRFVPPDEVRAAAKRAWSEPDTFSVPEITEALAKGEGLGIAELRKIAAHFADSSHEESAATRGAWGGEHASKWASRVIKKFGADDVSKRPKTLDYDTENIKRSIAHPDCCELCQDCEDQGYIEDSEVFDSGEDSPPHHLNCKCVIQYSTRRVRKSGQNTPVAKAGSGVMLAFWPDPKLAERLAVKGGEAAEELHITLAYFGQPVDLPMNSISDLEDAVEQYASAHAPVKVRLKGIGRFPATAHSDGKDVIYLKVASPTIKPFRAGLVKAAEDAWTAPKKNFDYTPHMTLALVEGSNAGALQSEEPEPLDVVFDRVVLSIGNKTKEYKLNPKGVGKVDFELSGSVVKVDQAQHLVFGWASIVSVNGKLVTDTQGDRIAEQTIEDSAYEFVLDARVAGVMHTESSAGKPVQIGSLVESCVFTPDKAAAMLASLKVQGIDAEMRMPFVGWWIGFKVSDPVTWDKVMSGELKAFSVGGRGKRAAIAA